MHRSFLRCALLSILAATAVAQTSDLTALSLEDFLSVEVTTVRKNPEKVSRSAAAVYVITSEDIRRSGANSLPEVLRLAPGVHVARITGTSWAVGIRGFNNIYSNKLLVMIDGRTVYNALLSGVLWSEDLVVLEDIQRIEVIRGPGAAMWGANAVAGVINVITKSAQATTGGIVSLSGGTLDPVKTNVRYGAPLGNAGAFRAWSQFSLQGQTRPRPDLPGLDPWMAGRAGVRLDHAFGDRDALLVEGEFERNGGQNASTLGSNTAAQGSVPTAGQASGFVMGRWTHTGGSGAETVLQVYDNEDSLDAAVFTARMRVLDLDLQHSIPLPGHHELMIGGGGRSNRIETIGTPQFYFDPASRTYRILNAFAQDEWNWVPEKLVLNLGAKLEHYTVTGAELEPMARLMWTPTPSEAFWVSVSRAVRTPAHTDFATRAPIVVPGLPVPLFLTGSDQFRPEVLRAVEAGARLTGGRRWGLDLALFRHYYDGLHCYRLPFPADMNPLALTGMIGQLAAFIPAVTTNALNGVNQGAEWTAHYDIAPHWKLTGFYSSLFTRTTFLPGTSAVNSFAFPNDTPKHEWQIRSSWDWRHGWSADLAFYRHDGFPDHVLSGYSQVDARIGRQLGEFAELSISGRNLLRPYQQESGGFVLYPSEFVPRSLELGLHWKF